MVNRALLALSVVVLLSCCRQHTPDRTVKDTPDRPAITGIALPKSGAILHSGDSIALELFPPRDGARIDSLVLYAGKEVPVRIQGFPGKCYWHAPKNRVGQLSLKVSVFYNDSLEESHSVSLVVLSDITPRQYTYKVVRQYPHDPDAYIQGLIYEEGMFYESTGLEGKSSIRIVDPATGKARKMVPMPSEYFAEGIALFNDQIYQITYKSQVGFVYDKHTLEQIRSFDYQIREGWGLTTDGKLLVMSDGSSQLYFIEPEFFTQVDKIDVFDNQGMVPSLNELEFINGNILANVYGESYIVCIDPASGKVTGKLDLHALMPKGSEGNMNMVLNGIAYNPANGHLFVTGKDWPVLYEIALTPSL
jgi:glutaminyl-peptide cyclotransferase